MTISVGTLTFFVDLKSRSVDGEFTAENIMDIMSTSKIFNDTAIDWIKCVWCAETLSKSVLDSSELVTKQWHASVLGESSRETDIFYLAYIYICVAYLLLHIFIVLVDNASMALKLINGITSPLSTNLIYISGLYRNIKNCILYWHILLRYGCNSSWCKKLLFNISRCFPCNNFKATPNDFCGFKMKL